MSDEEISQALHPLYRRRGRRRRRHHQPVRALPLILVFDPAGLRDLRGSRRGRTAPPCRTDRDLPHVDRRLGSAAWLVVAIWATTPLHDVLAWVPDLHMNLLGAVLIVLFGFLFVTVSSRLTGEIGSSSNPISGMTVATLLLTCLIFLMLGWTRPAGPADRPVGRRRRLHRRLQRRHHLAGPQDRLPGRRHAEVAAVGHPHRRSHFGPGHRRRS